MPSPDIQVVLLGTGTPNAEPTRSGPSIAVLVNDRPFLIDFGPGIVRRAAKAYQNGIVGLKPMRLDRAFLTHLHSDHTIGYPDLILTPWVLERETPLKVYGPIGLQSMTDHILTAYQEDIHERLNGLEPANPNGYQVVVKEISPGLVYQDDLVQVEALLANHGSFQAFSYKFTIDDIYSIIVSGDTAPYAEMVTHYAGCHILIHEVYSHKGLQGRTSEWRKYHASVHTSTIELAEIAQKAKPDLLVLYHQLFFDQTEDDMVEEIQAYYPGKIISGTDLDVFHLPSYG